MKKSTDLFDIADICTYFGLSEATIRRRIRESREGGGNFPILLFKSGCRVLWRKSDIEAWNGDAEVITFSPSPIPPAPAIKNNAQVRKGLQKLGVKQSDDESNN